MRWRSRLGALGYPIHHLTSAQLGLLVGTGRSRLGALGYPIHHLTSAQLGLLVGTVVWGALKSADIGVGVVWRPSAATFSLTRLLADAAAWRRSAWTGLGTNRGGESTGERSVYTATVWGW